MFYAVFAAYRAMYAAGLKMMTLTKPDLSDSSLSMRQRANICYLMYLPIALLCGLTPEGFSYGWGSLYNVLCVGVVLLFNPWFGFFTIATSAIFFPVYKVAAMFFPLVSLLVLVVQLIVIFAGIPCCKEWRNQSPST
ncbi:hypothetical protein KEM63_01395 [Halopseudomonas nanhaiensis]|uniref:hypothetical protein n=1 Tax=Halopseudomonas nanhaiensis TaxID=2830842 RepID=UPI001CBE4690|nr:hypothetical protein [Halopseudomonas nanhaiensis]UAW98668.1 hypothetical protein KEM63_01395 [Halopseudomonas nanhaiensis]